jgi:hypothetical protein
MKNKNSIFFKPYGWNPTCIWFHALHRFNNSLGGVSDRLIDTGFLNFILTDKDGTLLGYPIKEIENTPIVVESMEGMKPNASRGNIAPSFI